MRLKKIPAVRMLLSLCLYSPFPFCPPGSQAQGPIRVVATIPDLADLTERIGGDRVTVSSLARGVEDPHSVPMKPSFVSALNKADILVLQGLGFEHSFLPGLVEAARNPKIAPEGPGYIDCSRRITPLNVPAKLDRSLGEQHPLGNPHYNLDPISGRLAAETIAEGLSRNYPEQAETFTTNLNRFQRELDQHFEVWRKNAAPLKGIKFVSYHDDFAYLAARFEMVPAGTIELKPGVDPTPSHILQLQESMKRNGVRLVIREKHYPARLASNIAAATGATLIELPIMTRGVPEASDYIRFVDYNITQLVKAAEAAKSVPLNGAAPKEFQ